MSHAMLAPQNKPRRLLAGTIAREFSLLRKAARAATEPFVLALTHLRVCSPGTAKNDRRYTLHFSIIVLFSFLIITLGTVLISYSFEKHKRIALLTANDLFKHIVQRTAVSARELYAPAETLVDLMDQLPHEPGGSLQQRLRSLPFYAESLRRNQKLSAVYVGFENGEFFLVRALRGSDTVIASLAAPAGAEFVVQSIERDELGQRRYVTLYFDDSLKQISSDERFITGYDPRVRSWYQQAVHAAERVVTDFYVFYTTREIGTTIARRLANGTGVIGVDLTLQKISTELNQLSITPNNEMILFDNRGMVAWLQ